MFEVSEASAASYLPLCLYIYAFNALALASYARSHLLLFCTSYPLTGTSSKTDYDDSDSSELDSN